MTRAQRVVVIGDALIDELRDESRVREFPGGAALNVAVGLARLGLPTTLIAMVGDDEAGAHIRTYLDDYGVDLVATPSPLGTARAVSSRGPLGEPVYSFNEAAQKRRIRFGAVERELIASAAMTVVSCMAFDDLPQVRELADALTAASGLLAIDPNPRAGMLHDRAAFAVSFEQLAAASFLVKVGDDDAALLYERPLEDVRTRLADLGVPVVVATRGPGGAEVEYGRAVTTRPIAQVPGPVIDTMGAGDAVLASVVASVLSERPATIDSWGGVLEKAMQVAAATCRFEGALLRLPSALSGLTAGRGGS